MASSAPPTASIETAATTDEQQSDGSKLKTFLGILRKYVSWNSPVESSVPVAQNVHS